MIETAMSDESLKKSGKKPESPTLDPPQVELLADFDADDDLPDYDWPHVAEAPLGRAAYVPPMHVPMRRMDTGGLAAVIGAEAAEAARHAPSPEHTVVIDEHGAPVETWIDVDTFGDDNAIPTLQMYGRPTSDAPSVVARQSLAGKLGQGGWIGIGFAVAALFGCAWFVLNQRGFESGATPADTVGDLGATAPIRLVEPAAPASALAIPAPRTGVSVGDLPADQGTPAPPSGMSSRKVSPSVVQKPEQLPCARSAASLATARNRTLAQASSPRVGNEVIDPLFTEKPGY
jgi:hypothetical protein